MKSLQDLQKRFQEIKSGIETKIKNDISRKVGIEAVKMAKQNFKDQGFTTGSGTNSWEKRKPSTNKAYDKRRGVKGTVFRSSNPILRQTGKLYNSIHYEIIDKLIWIGLNEKEMPYGRIHNDGGTVTANIKAGTRRIFTKTKVRGSWSGFGKKPRAQTIEIHTGNREYKAHTRTIVMPRRRFLGMTVLHKKMIERICSEEIAKIIKKI
jgi:phage gpG-like protein